MKIIICPAVLWISSVLFPQVYYPYWYQIVIVGIVLALAGHMMEVLMLKEGTLWSSTIMDFIAATIIVYFASFFFVGARVTFTGALITAVLLVFTEYFQHFWLIRSGKTKKSGAA